MSKVNSTIMPSISSMNEVQLFPTAPHVKTEPHMATIASAYGVKALILEVQAVYPRMTVWYDVGNHDGYALDALNSGIKNIIYTNNNPEILDIARRKGATLAK